MINFPDTVEREKLMGETDKGFFIGHLAFILLHSVDRKVTRQ